MWAIFGPDIHTPTSAVDVTLVGPHGRYDVWVRGGSWGDHAADLRAADGKRVRFDRLPPIGAAP